jgi:prepilin-type processing-associated H-X9-DG protein
MHQNRGNVLFADGHVSQSLDFFSQSNHPGASLTSLILPDVPPPAIEPTLTQTPAGGGGGGGGGGGSAPAIAGGNLRVSFPARNPDFLTNAGTVTNLQITSGPRDTPRSAFVVPGPRGQDTPLPIPNFPSAESARTNTAAPAAPTPSPEKTDEQQVQQAHNDLVQGGRQLATKAARTTYVLPWWLIIALLLLALWLLKRAHDRTPRKSKPRTQAPSFFFSKER